MVWLGKMEGVVAFGDSQFGAGSHLGLLLPLLFSILFGILLGFGPRLEPLQRIVASTLLGAGSLALWVRSADLPPSAFTSGTAQAVLAGIGVLAFVALLVLARGARVSGLALLCILAWLISYFSSSHGGMDPMVAWVERIFGLSADAAHTLVVAFRKSVHFTFYGVVGLCGFLAAFRNRSGLRQAFLFAMLMVVLYAGFDEVRQASQPNRQGSILDVALDAAGAAAFLGFLRWQQIRQELRPQES